MGPTGEESRHGATGGEPRCHRPESAQSHPHSGLPGPAQGKLECSHANTVSSKHLAEVYMVLSICYCILLQREEFTREPTLLKKLCSAIREGVTVDNCCDLFAAVYLLCGDDMEDDPLLELERQKQEEVR